MADIFDEKYLDNVKINYPALKKHAEYITSKCTVKKQWQAAWLLRAITCIDLTTLSGDDTTVNVKRLCYKAANPVPTSILDKLGMSDANITCAAVCIYPSNVKYVSETLHSIGKNIAVCGVSTGFPSGQYHLKTRLEEIRLVTEDGANEVDVVISRAKALSGDWIVILAVGELGSMSNVYKASMVAMMAGADFIKTSTGKEGVNSTIPVGLVMCRAIKDYYKITGRKVGLKPAGGIRTAKEALIWLTLVKEELGNDWLNRNMFRIGASSLLGDIERQLYHYAYGCYASESDFPLA